MIAGLNQQVDKIMFRLRRYREIIISGVLFCFFLFLRIFMHIFVDAEVSVARWRFIAPDFWPIWILNFAVVISAAILFNAIKDTYREIKNNILVFCVFGAFSIFDRYVDVWVAFICGVLGFFAKKYDYPIAAIILGIVLGGIAESGFVNGILVSRGSFVDFFTRPVTLGILVISALFFLIPLIDNLLQQRKQKQKEQLSPR